MPDRSVQSEVRDGVLYLTLNRPESLNILDVPMRKDILRVLKAHSKDKAVRCVVISARGNTFSAGADINYLLKLSRPKAKAYVRFVRSFLEYLENYPIPTIGMVEGVAVGGGLEMLLALDIVVAGSEANFGLTELNVGLMPGGGGSQRLPRTVGVRKSKEMIYTGAMISAGEAFELGLVNRVVPTGYLQEGVGQLCEIIKQKSPDSLRLAKQAINQSFQAPLKKGLDFENKMYAGLLTSKEARERMRAFLGKKKEPRTSKDRFEFSWSTAQAKTFGEKKS